MKNPWLLPYLAIQVLAAECSSKDFALRSLFGSFRAPRVMAEQKYHWPTKKSAGEVPWVEKKHII